MFTTDPNDPRLKNILPSGQQEVYLVLSQEERDKGFVRPVRRSYRHVGSRPKHPTRPLTEDEQKRYSAFNYALFEMYPESMSPVTGRYWTEKELKNGCGTITSMGISLCETYARNPSYYQATFCCECGAHYPVAEFVWEEDGQAVGS